MGNDAGMPNKLMTFCAAFALTVAVLGAAARSGQATEKAPSAAKPDEKAPKAAAPMDKAASKEVTLKGEMTCAKCGLHESKTCQNVLRVKDASDGGKETKYYLTKNAVSDDKHEKVCKGSAPATVTGAVGEDHGKKVMTASSVKYD